ncbi:MAG: hypothetical protein GY694_10870 [Gammaproteobacteria bacterium]|nr:hypothetical protein [Gammaproteobacteria bacterium]
MSLTSTASQNLDQPLGSPAFSSSQVTWKQIQVLVPNSHVGYALDPAKTTNLPFIATLVTHGFIKNA